MQQDDPVEILDVEEIAELVPGVLAELEQLDIAGLYALKVPT